MDAVAHYNKMKGMKGVSMAVLRPRNEMYLYMAAAYRSLVAFCIWFVRI